jgi:hypothetical protein
MPTSPCPIRKRIGSSRGERAAVDEDYSSGNAAPIQQVDSVAVRARLQAQGIAWNPQRLGGFHMNLHTWASNNHTPVPWLHDFGVNSVPALYTMAPSVARVVLEN